MGLTRYLPCLVRSLRSGPLPGRRPQPEVRWMIGRSLGRTEARGPLSTRPTMARGNRTGCPPARQRLCPSSRTGRPTGRSPPACSWPRRPSRTTSAGSTPSSAWARDPPPSPTGARPPDLRTGYGPAWRGISAVGPWARNGDLIQRTFRLSSAWGARIQSMQTLTDARQRADARLLVVEDEPNILELLSASLRYAGFDVVTAAAGTEAVQAAQRHRPDLIVLDVMLPDMDGFDVVRRLRGGGARIPVVFLTARDSTEDKIRGLTLGGDDYVTKPFSLEEVIARIRAVLRRTRGDGTEPPPRLKFADLELDEDSHEVWRSGEQI